MQRKKKFMSECRLIDLKNIELYYKCKECNDESINELNKKFPIRIDFVIKMLINWCLYL